MRRDPANVAVGNDLQTYHGSKVYTPRRLGNPCHPVNPVVRPAAHPAIGPTIGSRSPVSFAIIQAGNRVRLAHRVDLDLEAGTFVVHGKGEKQSTRSNSTRSNWRRCGTHWEATCGFWRSSSRLVS